MKKPIVLIGGMPTAGKSTLAEALSKHLGLPWISTDQIGTAMRAVAIREQCPELFTWDDYGGFRYLTELTAAEIADNEFAKGEAVWPGVRKLIVEDVTWNQGFIVEGDDILPHLVAQDFVNSNNIFPIFVGDLDVERVRNAVFTRNFAGDGARKYPDDVKEKEVQWVLTYGEKLRGQVLKYKMPWIEVEKSEQDLARVLKALEEGGLIGQVITPSGVESQMQVRPESRIDL